MEFSFTNFKYTRDGPLDVNDVENLRLHNLQNSTNYDPCGVSSYGNIMTLAGTSEKSRLRQFGANPY